MKPNKLVSLFTALLLAAPLARAIDFDWTGASGVDNNWLTPGNWAPAGPPTGGGGNHARFLLPATVPALINADTPNIQDFLTGNNGVAGIRQVDHVAGQANFNNGWFRMGALGGVGDVGTYNLSGGQVNTGSYRIGEQTGQIATVNVTGGVLRQNDVGDIGDGGAWNRIGENATANMNISGTGVVSFDSRTLIGVGTGSTNIVQTDGMFEVRRGEFTLGDGKAAFSPAPNDVYNISGGTLIARTNTGNGDSGGNVTIGQWDNANAKLIVSGTANVRADQDVNIANGREITHRGEIELTGGQITFGSSFHMSTNLASTGVISISDGQLRQDDGDPNDQNRWNHIGGNGVATFNLAGGLASFSARTHLGSVAGSNATVNQTGGVFEVRNHELIIGDAGTGTYNVSGGTLQTAGSIAVGNWNSSAGAFNVDGTANVAIGDRLLIGQVENATFVSSGTVTQTGGTMTIANSIDMTVSATSNALFVLAGGTLDLTNSDVRFGPGTSSFVFAGGVLRGLANFQRALSQDGGIFEVGGLLGPGGATTVNGDFTQSAGTLTLELATGSIGDLLNVNGSVSLNGLLDLVPGALVIGDTFVIIQNDGVEPVGGLFAGRPDDQDFVEDGTLFRINYNGGDGNDVVVEVVPEPSALLALLGGMGVLALRRRRKS